VKGPEKTPPCPLGGLEARRRPLRWTLPEAGGRQDLENYNSPRVGRPLRHKLTGGVRLSTAMAIRRSLALSLLAGTAAAFAPSPAGVSLRGASSTAVSAFPLPSRPALASAGRQAQIAARAGAAGGLRNLRAGVETDALNGIEVVSVATGAKVPAAKKTGKVRPPPVHAREPLEGLLE
jgi:hypothetical protein